MDEGGEKAIQRKTDQQGPNDQRYYHILKKHAVKLKKYADYPRLKSAPTKRLTEDEQIAVKKKREKVAALFERRQQEGTERAAVSILLSAAAVRANTAAQQDKSTSWPRPSTRARSGPTSILDSGYLGRNIITPQDAVQANYLI